MQVIEVTMENLDIGGFVVREIDKSVGTGGGADEHVSTSRIREWVKERAEAQHEARLGFVSWRFLPVR